MKNNRKVIRVALRPVSMNVKHMSDTFVCSSCGARAIKKIYGNSCTCSNCGGTMYRS